MTHPVMTPSDAASERFSARPGDNLFESYYMISVILLHCTFIDAPSTPIPNSDLCNVQILLL
jgi:hypothetical protein